MITNDYKCNEVHDYKCNEIEISHIFEEHWYT